MWIKCDYFNKLDFESNKSRDFSQPLRRHVRLTPAMQLQAAGTGD